ncbi:MAG: hypothetical protein R3D27_13945 [Hyphomicrobiaceae bacterium]
MSSFLDDAVQVPKGLPEDQQVSIARAILDCGAGDDRETSEAPAGRV